MGDLTPTTVVAIASVTAIAIGLIIGCIKWTRTVDVTLGTVDVRLNAIDGKLNTVETDIKTLLGRSSQVSAGASPLRLTDMGEDISEKLKASDWVKKIAEAVADQIEGKQPFEIQEFCFNYMENDFKATADQENQFGEVAYNHGLEKEEILRVLGIVLRDELLKRAGFEPEPLP